MGHKQCIVCGKEATMSEASVTNDGLLHHACRSDYFASTERYEDGQDASAKETVADIEGLLPSKYGAGRIVSGIGEFLGWFLLLLGVVLAFITASQDGRALGYFPPLGIGGSGLYLVMMAQFIRATYDNADTSREILRILQTKTQ